MIIEFLQNIGFNPETQGAGIMSRFFEGGTSICVTGADGGLPSDDSWLICIYAPVGEGFEEESPPLWQHSSEEGDPAETAGQWRESIYAAVEAAEAVDGLRRIDRHVIAASKPPLSIDVSAVKRSGDGWTVTDDAHAVGYGVYIRNPLAHHVADFLLPDWQAASPERLAEAKRAAFAYADHLAAHLGCAVDGGERPAEAVPLGDLLHGAACLWEEALNLQGRNADPKGGAMPYAPHAVAEFLREWDGNGSVHMRVMVTSWAEECERDWKSAHDAGKFDAPYDWEWCPRWLAQRLEAIYPAPAAPAPVDGRRMVPGDLFTAPFSPAHILFAYPADGGAN